MTINKTSLKEFKSSRPFELLKAKDTLGVEPPSQEEIDEFAVRLKALHPVASLVLFACVIASLLGVFTLCAGLLILLVSDFWEGASVVTVGFLFLTAGINFVERYEDVYGFKDTTEKLKSREACDKALALTEQHAQCSAYRDAVLAQGREFYMLDLALLESICKQAELQKEADITKERCQKLHGISA